MSEEKKLQLSFVIDIDGTLCPIKKSDESYSDLIPYEGMVKKLQDYHLNGVKIILFTSRNMNSYNGNIGKINKQTAPILFKWLDRWSIPYDEIYFGKPWPGHYGFYVDDRAVRPSEFLNNTPEELLKICNENRPKHTQLDVVITMGGRGNRFRKAGYDKPKYMIEANGKTLFDWSMISLEGYRQFVSQYIFVVIKDDKEDVKVFIEDHCKALGINNYHIIIIDFLTDGQATTAMLASQYWNLDNRLLIYNIDTYVEPYHMNYRELRGDGFIPCFYGKGDHWSFVEVDTNNKAIEIKEKVRISNNCTLGAYYFRTSRLFTKLYLEYYTNPANLTDGEKYIAPLYQYLVDNGGEVYISNVDCKYVNVLGTPDELNAFISIER